jgi:hypothetical protein
MRAGGHILAGGVGSILLYPFPSLPGLVFWLSSVLIDIDHYLDFIYRNGFTDFRIKGMFLYHDVLKGFWGRPEFLLDWIYLYRHKVLTLRAYSVIEYLIRKRRLVTQGLSPGTIYSEALRYVNDAHEK